MKCLTSFLPTFPLKLTHQSFPEIKQIHYIVLNMCISYIFNINISCITYQRKNNCNTLRTYSLQKKISDCFLVK